jgi:hypothetical protein
MSDMHPLWAKQSPAQLGNLMDEFSELTRFAVMLQLYGSRLTGICLYSVRGPAQGPLGDVSRSLW